MRLLLDTHVLIWTPSGDPRMSPSARLAIERQDAELFVSAVTAFELTDLQASDRVALKEPVAVIADAIGLTILDFPSGAWAVAAALPDIHRDPVDRMLIAHAMLGGFTLVTADRDIRRYPLETLW